MVKNKIDFIDTKTLLDAVLSNKFALIAVLFLMPFNWGIELLKWRTLTKKFQKLTLWEEIRSILAGVLIGLVTPNRVGELGGRLLYIEKKNRSRALYANSVCSLSQLLITLLFGLFALSLLIEHFENYSYFSTKMTWIFSILIGTLLIWAYFKSNSLKIIFNFFGKKISEDQKIDDFKVLASERLNLLAYSAIRYLIFCTQFTILLLVFYPNIEFIVAFMAVSLIYLGAALVPTALLTSLPVKTSFSFFVVESIGYDGMYGIVASLILWMINLFIPALFGLIILSGTKSWRVK